MSHTPVRVLVSNINSRLFRYSPQSTCEDGGSSSQYLVPPSELRACKLRETKRKRFDYKPISLRWYFATAEIIIILSAIALLAWIYASHPDSDSTASIRRRDLVDAQQPSANGEVAEEYKHKEVLRARADSLNFANVVEVEMMDSPKQSLTLEISRLTSIPTIPSVGNLAFHELLSPASSSQSETSTQLLSEAGSSESPSTILSNINAIPDNDAQELRREDDFPKPGPMTLPGTTRAITMGDPPTSTSKSPDFKTIFLPDLPKSYVVIGSGTTTTTATAITEDITTTSADTTSTSVQSETTLSTTSSPAIAITENVTSTSTDTSSSSDDQSRIDSTTTSTSTSRTSLRSSVTNTPVFLSVTPSKTRETLRPTDGLPKVPATENLPRSSSLSAFTTVKDSHVITSISPQARPSQPESPSLPESRVGNGNSEVSISLNPFLEPSKPVVNNDKSSFIKSSGQLPVPHAKVTVDQPKPDRSLATPSQIPAITSNIVKSQRPSDGFAGLTTRSPEKVSNGGRPHQLPKQTARPSASTNEVIEVTVVESSIETPAPSNSPLHVTTTITTSSTTSQPIFMPMPIVVIECVPATQQTTLIQTFSPLSITQEGSFAGGKPSVTVTTPEPLTIITGVTGVWVTNTALWTVASTTQTLTFMWTVGATPTTITTTPPPRTVTSTLADRRVEQVITQAPRTVLSIVGGTAAYFTRVVGPNVTKIVTTTTFVASVEATTSTFVTTPAPSTVIQMIDGKISTQVATFAPITSVTVIDSTLTTFATRITLRAERAAQTSDPTIGFIESEPRVYGFTEGEYFLSQFLPTLLTIIISIPLSVIDANAKMYQPFHSLKRPGGANARDGIMLRFYGYHTITEPIRLLFSGQPVTFLTSILVWLSWIATPLAAEAVGMKVHGECSHLSITGCGVAIGVSKRPLIALLLIFGAMATFLVVLLFILCRWRTGVTADPWCLAGIASLVSDPDTRRPLVQQSDIHNDSELMATLDGSIHRLGPDLTSTGSFQYGIVPIFRADSPMQRPVTSDDELSKNPIVLDTTLAGTWKRGRHMPFFMFTYIGRAIFMFLLLGMLALILLYRFLNWDSAFELFLDNHDNPDMGSSLGLRFGFAGIGVLLKFLWDCFFFSTTSITPFLAMAHTPNPETPSLLLLPRPTTAAHAMLLALRYRTHSPFLTLLLPTSFLALLTPFLPVLLANIPFSLTQTYTTYIVCTSLAAVILSLMTIIIGMSFANRAPHMPVDPRTIAGATFYICDSHIVRDLTPCARMSAEERKTWILERHGKCSFGEWTGVSGVARVGIDWGSEGGWSSPQLHQNMI